MDTITAKHRQSVLQVRSNILNGFKNQDVITKSMTEDDFRSSHTKENHEIYTRKSLVEFEKAIRSEVGERESVITKAIDEAIDGLSKINVTTIEGKVVPVWVRERKKQ